MNLRKKQPQVAPVGSDSQLAKNQEPLLADRPNRREITQTAKYLINFINEVNKDVREAKRKKERKFEEEIQRPEPVKKIKPEKPPTNVVIPPKVVTKPAEKKVPIQKEPPKTAQDYYKFSDNPFGIEGYDPKRMPISPSFPIEFLLSQNKQLESPHPYIPTNFDYMAFQNHLQNMNLQGIPQNIHGLPKMPAIHGLQGLAGIQGMQGLQGIQNIPGIGLVHVNPANNQFFMNGNSYIRVPMMAPQIPQMTQNMNMRIGNEKKMFKRASYHAAIAYYIHLEKLKKKSEVEQLDQAFIDPTYHARKMREQNRGDSREVMREQEGMIEQQPPK